MCKTNFDLLKKIVSEKLIPEEILSKYEAEAQKLIARTTKFAYLELFAKISRMNKEQMMEKNIPYSIINQVHPEENTTHNHAAKGGPFFHQYKNDQKAEQKAEQKTPKAMSHNTAAHTPAPHAAKEISLT